MSISVPSGGVTGHSTPLRVCSACICFCATRAEGTLPAAETLWPQSRRQPKKHSSYLQGPMNMFLIHFIVKSEEEHDYKRNESSLGCSHLYAPTVIKCNF